MLDLVGIKDKAKRYPDELSAGEQQRVGIARALVNKPRVLICDEPTGNLDPITAMEIMELLEQINIRGTTVLMVTHARDIVNKMNKRKRTSGIIGVAVGAVIMVVGYTLGRAYVYSTPEYAILKLPFQIAMAVIGGAAAIILVYVLKLGKIKDKYF